MERKHSRNIESMVEREIVEKRETERQEERERKKEKKKRMRWN
jgi:hypothetical protein